MAIISSNNGCYHNKPKKVGMFSSTFFNVVFLSVLVITLPALVFLHASSFIAVCPSSTTDVDASLAHKFSSWSGNLLDAEFSWNHLRFYDRRPPPERLRIAVFSRKWPVGSAPGGMERHAHTLFSALARRGHQVHVFTSASSAADAVAGEGDASPVIHFLKGVPDQWKPDNAWTLFQEENRRSPFDAVHSESVALPYRLAAELPNLAVTWHGIALEAIESSIVQDLVRSPDEPMSPDFAKAMSERPLKLLNEIRFFQSYNHHVAISDSSGEMLRDVYQIPRRRVHVILNGVDDHQFTPDGNLGRTFRAEIGVPSNATLVMGVAGRLVKDKGHPLLHEAFSRLTAAHPDVYLIVAGSGPWAKRYSDLGPRVLVLGALPPTKLKAFYNSIDVFLNPTLRPQGLDLTLMEAMQCGKPVAATRFKSIKGSVVVDGEFGHLFAPNVESLVEVLQNVVGEGSRRLAKRGRKCREYAADMFAAGKMAMAYERLFLCIKDGKYCRYPTPETQVQRP